MRPNLSPAQLERRRMRAAKLLLQGKSLSEVAERVGASVSSVHRWKQVLDKSGTKGLSSKQHAGQRPRLSPSQKRGLKRIVLQGARAAGFPDDWWYAPFVVDVIQQRFGVTYRRDSIGWLLRSLGLSNEELVALGFVNRLARGWPTARAAYLSAIS